MPKCITTKNTLTGYRVTKIEVPWLFQSHAYICVFIHLFKNINNLKKIHTSIVKKFKSSDCQLSCFCIIDLVSKGRRRLKDFLNFSNMLSFQKSARILHLNLFKSRGFYSIVFCSQIKCQCFLLCCHQTHNLMFSGWPSVLTVTSLQRPLLLQIGKHMLIISAICSIQL